MGRCDPLVIKPLALALDRKDTSAKSRWLRSRKIEGFFAARLRRIAHYIEDYLRQFDGEHPERNGWIIDALRRYAETIEPWARSVCERMAAEVAARDRKTWREVSAQMGAQLHHEIDNAPLGNVLRKRLDEQVELIKSIPRDAAERVHKLATEAAYTGERYTTLVDKIMEGGHVSRSRASLIARTEVGRVATEITKARAEYVGSPGYIWATSRDFSVRESHRAMEGRFVAWNDPPTLDGMTGHAGALPNCRCTPMPQIPDVD